MTITHEDFFRLLPTVVTECDINWNMHAALLHLGAGTVEIKLAPEQRRQLGSLDLPVTEVTLSFKNVSAPDRDEFLARFHRAYQKGGG